MSTAKKVIGRPARADGTTKINVTTLLEPVEIEALDQVRRERPDMPTRSALIREAVLAFLKKQAK